MNKKTIRKLALIFVIFFSIYFMLGSIFSCYIKTNGFYNMFFGTDSHRVFIDLTNESSEDNDIIVRNITKIGHFNDKFNDEMAIAISKDFDIDFNCL